MKVWVFQVAVCWLCLLSCVLSVYALRTKSMVVRILAFDTLSLTVVGILCTLAAKKAEAFFLDLGLVVGMVVFVQTLAAVRYAEKRPE